MTPQLVMIVATKVFPAAVFLFGRVRTRLSVGTAGGATHPATGLARVGRAEAVALAAALAAALALALAALLAVVLEPLVSAELSPTNPAMSRRTTTTTPMTCLFLRESLARWSSTA